jgi:hypothetical protein
MIKTKLMRGGAVLGVKTSGAWWRSPPRVGKAEAVEIRATGFGEI